MINANRRKLFAAIRLPLAALSLLGALALLLTASHIGAQSVSNNALLSDLTLSDVALDPAFDSNTFNYLGFANRRFLQGVATAMRVRATSHDPNATVVIKNNGAVDDDASVTYDVSPADQVITVEVTGSDGVTTQTYRVEMATKLIFVGDSRVEEGSGGQLSLALNKRTSKNTTVTLSTNNHRRATLTPTVRTIRRNLLGSSGFFRTLDNDRYFDYQLRVNGRVTENSDEVHDPDDFFITIIDDDYPIPDVPANFQVTSAGGKTTFDWDNVIKHKNALEVNYHIHVRNPGESDDDWVFLAATGSHEVNPPMVNHRGGPVYLPHEGPLTDQRLPVGGTYEFAMRALSIVRTDGESGVTGSAVLGELTAPFTHTVNGPNQPLRVRAERTIDLVRGPVRLTWRPPPLYPDRFLPPLMSVPIPNVDTSVVQYTISRADAPADDDDVATPPDHGATYTNIDSVAGNVLTYTDTTASDTKGYFYRVVALSPEGVSDRSRHAFVYPAPGATDDPGTQTHGPLTGFTLVDSSDQSTLAALTDGLSVELADPDGGAFGIRADVDGATTIGSVRLVLSGAKRESRTESVAPYSLYGDEGANLIYGASLPAGSYTLTATAYSEHSRRGDQLGAREISFTITEAPAQNPLTGFTLVDASDQTVLASLTNGASVGLDDPNGGSYAIRADVDGATTIGSVRLELSGAKTVSRTENVAPFSLYGDGGANALSGGNLPAGSYTLTATAYKNRSLGGNTLGTLEITFTITVN